VQLDEALGQRKPKSRAFGLAATVLPKLLEPPVRLARSSGASVGRVASQPRGA
jgi:hypothetical protein